MPSTEKWLKVRVDSTPRNCASRGVNWRIVNLVTRFACRITCAVWQVRERPDTKGMRNARQLAGVVMLVGTLSLGIAQQAAASSANVAALQVALKAIGLYP